MGHLNLIYERTKALLHCRNECADWDWILEMTANRRIFLNIIATYGRSLYALIIGLFCGRWTLMALGEVDYGLIGVVGGLTA